MAPGRAEGHNAMTINKERAQPIGYTDIRVIDAAYALSKTQNEDNAREILQGVPPSILPALRKHMTAHANLFTAAIHAMVAKGPEEPKLAQAKALFS
jgi:hypothetical protein